MFGKLIIFAVIFIGLPCLAACTAGAGSPTIKLGTVVIKQIGLGQPTAQATTAKESANQVIESEEEPQTVSATKTVEIVKDVTEETQATPIPSATITVDATHPKVSELLHQITLVQHHHNLETGHDYFTCASRGQGLYGVEIDPQGPRFVGPNSMDFDLWGIVSLFKINPNGTIFLVPQKTGGWYVDPEGIEHTGFTLNEALTFFAGGDAIWIGAHAEPGRIAECDPQYVTPTPTPKHK